MFSFKSLLKPTTILGWLILVVVVAVLLLAGSWVAGQFQGCTGPPKPPPVIPGHADPGTPVAGPVAEAPTTPSVLVIATPDLTPEEVAALMKKYGLVKAKKNAPKPGKGALPPASEADWAPEPQPTPTRPYPLPLAEEHFSFSGVPGIGISVSAWQLSPGGRVDLRGVWDSYQPPTPDPPKQSYFGNEARFHRYLIAGGIAVKAGGTTKLEPGIGWGLSYEGWLIKKVTLDAHVAGMVTQTGNFAAFGGVGLGW